MLLRADADTAPQLSTLKKGERVKVNYKNSQGEKVATKITPA
jgi:cold shock CspA family protein